jgi:ABC-type phosphate/phosphonate transport system permease subunit
MEDIKNTHKEDLSMPSKRTTSSFLRLAKWVVIFAAVLAIVIFFASTIGINKLRSARAGAQVTDFVSALYPSSTIVGKVCQGEDTDNDSYVSCAVTISSRENPLSVQCPTIVASYLGTTCRLTPGVSPVNM